MQSYSHFDLAFTASEAQSVDALQHAVGRYLSARADVPDLLADLLKRDPDMPMALVLQGYLYLLAAHPSLQPSLQDIETRLSKVPTLNTREKLHHRAFKAWLAGATRQCLEILLEVSQAYPTDTIALRAAHYLLFYEGDGEAMQHATGAVLPAWQPEHPHFSYLLGMHAFGLEEHGRYSQARDYALDALARNRNDLWAIHAYDHCCYMQGDHRAGLEWLSQHADALHGANNFANHLVWHEALHHIGLHDGQAALNLYDERLAGTTADDFYLDMCNNASLLWRLEQKQIDTGNRWQALAEVAAGHADDRALPFAGLHYLLAISRGSPENTSPALSNFATWQDDTTDAGRLCRDVAYKLACAMAADQPAVSAKAQALTALGGSKAQRELFEHYMAI